MPRNAVAPRMRVVVIAGAVALAALGVLFGPVNAAIVRGSAGTTGDNNDGIARVYVTATAPALGSLTARQQAWITPGYALATPKTITVDENGTPTQADCVVVPFCSYAIGPADSRILSVTGLFQILGQPEAFPVAGVQVRPRLDVTWTVSRFDPDATPQFDVVYARTFGDVPYGPADGSLQTFTHDLDLSALQPGSYRISVEFEFVVPAEYAIYEFVAISALPPGALAPDPDIRTLTTFNGGRVSLVGTTYTMRAGTSLEIAASDSVAPTSTLTLSPAANAAGWNRTSVSGAIAATDTAQDGLAPSGLEFIAYSGSSANPLGNFAGSSPSSPANFVVDAEGATTLSWYATDQRGNAESPQSRVVSIDYGNPQIAGTVAPAPTAEGWHASPPTVTFTCADALSGVATCSAPVTVSTSGANQPVVGTATDRAGNTATAQAIVNVDPTPPTVSGAAAPAANPAGWNAGPVVVTFTCADAESGIRNCTTPTTLSAEGTNQSATGTGVNKAGLTASATIAGISIDRTPPSVAVTGVTSGATYVVGSVPAAGCTTTDALSGVATPATASTNGAGANGVGSLTTTCGGATDVAGNTGSASVGYRVTYAFQGFFQPVDNLPVLNRVRAGQAIPVKFALGGDFGLGVLAAGSPGVQQIACSSGLPVDDVEETVAAGGSALTYDAASGRYVYVWKTSAAFAGTCRALVLTLNDGTSRTAMFHFR